MALRLAVIIVTWNRKTLVAGVLDALLRQSFGPDHLDVVVVDNASTDGTVEYLTDRFAPDATADNPTTRAHRPEFRPPFRPPPAQRAGPRFASLTIVRNHANLGGCGGFNTGLSYVEQAFEIPGVPPPDYVWLVDDDIDLPADAAERLTAVAESDPAIGLVGSRTVDLNRRDTTIETTIYFNPETGRMSDEPPLGHPQAQSHRAWVASAGGTHGARRYSGVRDVDVVSACSLLARWSAARKIGFWDYRYFIYCDDADWCLRFAKAGYRVVLSLDAVVFHTPWHHKLTPARAYYAQRNILWVIQKILPRDRLRRVTLRWSGKVLAQSFQAALHRRLFHAEIIRRSIDDMASQRWGKLDDEGPPSRPLAEALDAAGLLKHSVKIAIVCNRPDAPAWAAEFRALIAGFLEARGRREDVPGFIEFIRNDVPGATVQPIDGTSRSVYSGRLRSKLRRQAPFFFRPPDALVVYEQDNDFPLLNCSRNIHIDRRRPEECQIEDGSMAARLRFLWRWCRTAARSVWYAARLQPYVSPTRYG